MAPFWDDINLNSGGTISYETFESGYYLEQVNAFIQRQRPTSFNGTWMMNVYYQEVAPFSGSGEVNKLVLKACMANMFCFFTFRTLSKQY